MNKDDGYNDNFEALKKRAPSALGTSLCFKSLKQKVPMVAKVSSWPQKTMPHLSIKLQIETIWLKLSLWKTAMLHVFTLAFLRFRNWCLVSVDFLFKISGYILKCKLCWSTSFLRSCLKLDGSSQWANSKMWDLCYQDTLTNLTRLDQSWWMLVSWFVLAPKIHWVSFSLVPSPLLPSLVNNYWNLMPAKHIHLTTVWPPSQTECNYGSTAMYI